MQFDRTDSAVPTETLAAGSPAAPGSATRRGAQPAGSYRREAWARYRAAAERFARNPDEPAAADALEQAVEGLRRAAAVEAWRHPLPGA
jgi:hypothetical protein